MAKRRTARKRGMLGRYYVYPTATAVRRTWSLFRGSTRSVFVLRKHVLKLMYFPGGHPDSKVIDLDWDWIDGTGKQGIGELRIEESISGCDNLRVVFFVATTPLKFEPLPRIWILSVFQKKNRRFSPTELRIFTAQKKLVVKRFYSDGG